jgi:hypothetical protein
MNTNTVISSATSCVVTSLVAEHADQATSGADPMVAVFALSPNRVTVRMNGMRGIVQHESAVKRWDADMARPPVAMKQKR